ncbi:MAG: M24 family metallopeptidase [Gemmatimonas sp.]
MRTMHSVLKHGALYWDRDLLPESLYRERLKALQAVIAESGDEAWLLYGDVERHGNVVYATNFMPRVRSALAFVPKSGAPVLLANIGLRDVPAAKTITWVDDVRPFGRLPKDLSALIEGKGLSQAAIGVCGFEESLPVADWTAIQKNLPSVRWSDRGPRLRAMRAAKQPAEVAAIRRAAGMADAALALAPAVLRPGIPMRQAIAAIDRHVREAGAEDARYLVAIGAQAGVSLRPVDDRLLSAGDAVVLTMAVQSQRYWAETARTFVLGKASRELAELHDAAAGAVAAMQRATKAGTASRAIAAAGHAALDDPAAATAAMYGFGNGIGLDAEEGPAIDESDREIVVRCATLALRAVVHRGGQGAAAAATVVVDSGGSTALGASSSLVELPA